MVTKVEYETLKSDLRQLRLDVNELQSVSLSRGVTLDRLREAVQRLRDGK